MHVIIGILFVMSTIIEWIFDIFQIVSDSILPDTICGVTMNHYRVVFFASLAIIIAIFVVGIGSMMGLENMDFITAFYFSAQTSSV